MNFPSDYGFAATPLTCIACGHEGSGACCDGHGNRRAEVEVFQDGADFYRNVDDERSAHIVSYPDHVLDYDTAAARRAREWFKDVWCPENGITPVFI